MMKDTFYFSHDYNSRTDEKIKLLIRKHGMLGYGIFWAIIEDLYNNANALKLDYEGISYDLRVDVEIVKSIINEFGLFQIKDGFFGSLSVQKRLEERKLKSKKASDSASLRWSKSDANINKEEKGIYPQTYIIKMYDENECFIKIGIANSTISERYSGKIPYKYDVLLQYFSSENINIEVELHNLLKEYAYLPKCDFSGKNECYCIDSLEVIKKYTPIF